MIWILFLVLFQLFLSLFELFKFSFHSFYLLSLSIILNPSGIYSIQLNTCLSFLKLAIISTRYRFIIIHNRFLQRTSLNFISRNNSDPFTKSSRFALNKIGILMHDLDELLKNLDKILIIKVKNYLLMINYRAYQW